MIWGWISRYAEALPAVRAAPPSGRHQRAGSAPQGGSLLPEYTDEEFAEATFSFVKYYVQSVHYDTLVEENKKLRYELDQEMEWKTRTDG